MIDYVGNLNECDVTSGSTRLTGLNYFRSKSKKNITKSLRPDAANRDTYGTLRCWSLLL
jgi:hypothetical protein